MTSVEEWQAALKVANEERRAELTAGGEFKAPEAVDDPIPPLTRSWLTTGRGSVGYERNGLEHEPKRPT